MCSDFCEGLLTIGSGNDFDAYMCVVRQPKGNGSRRLAWAFNNGLTATAWCCSPAIARSVVPLISRFANRKSDADFDHGENCGPRISGPPRAAKARFDLESSTKWLSKFDMCSRKQPHTVCKGAPRHGDESLLGSNFNGENQTMFN